MNLVVAVIEVEPQSVEIQHTGLYLVVPLTSPSTSSTTPVRNMIKMWLKFKMECNEGTEWRRGLNLTCLINCCHNYATIFLSEKKAAAF